jgi:OMF family outer membrane factor
MEVGLVVEEQANSTLSLNYDMYTSGGRSASIRSAEEQVRSAELEVERQNQQLSLDVSNDYYNIQQAEELIRVTQAAVENAQVNLRDTEAQERAGIGTRFDVLQAQVQLANAVQDLTQARNLQNISRRQLAQRLSLADAATLSSADPVEIAGRWNLSLEESIILALQSRAELAQLLAQRNIAQQQRRIALASIGPQLSAFANFNIVDQLDDSNLGAYGYAIGILVSMNFYDGGAARASAAQQEANIAIAQTQFATTKNQIRFQVEQAYFTLQSSFENIQTASTALEQARESLRLARLRFQAGVGTQLDVISAAANLTQAQGNLVAAILDYNRSLASLQRAVSNAQVPTP